MIAIGASAQHTYNVRAGGAVLDKYFALTAMAQANISLNHHGSWTFSPAMQFAAETDEYGMVAMLHANMGYRTRIGNNCLFAPKVGVAGGFICVDNEGYSDNGWPIGPSIDLTFEFKHLVIGLTGFFPTNLTEGVDYTHDDSYIPLVSLTLGYTF